MQDLSLKIKDILIKEWTAFKNPELPIPNFSVRKIKDGHTYRDGDIYTIRWKLALRKSGFGDFLSLRPESIFSTIRD